MNNFHYREGKFEYSVVSNSLVKHEDLELFQDAVQYSFLSVLCSSSSLFMP